jgi:hypothetical protein
LVAKQWFGAPQNELWSALGLPRTNLHEALSRAGKLCKPYIRHWLKNVWMEFDRINLTDIVNHSKKAHIDRKASKGASAVSAMG